ncbi:MAG: PadR family transcriptional regulator [Parvimonas sp.]|uniref:PadR family transcriptional regulator n=1 Tax=Parvimonas sp. TaxID=1944660 RepID=UPI0025D2B926|nr:PadR family transcriptional regulator [Parvimonas sp.]MCI5997866.1 PadR family transcriptional regulator [Parvimonas sp.]MDY3050553.1 PadR family transcriptional regulator [Parvimonas sp.]
MYYPISALLIECIILSVVDVKDSYGYEISQSVKKVAMIKESTLYPILKKLEQNEFLITYDEEYAGRKRKYYKITESGKTQLKFLKSEWISYRDEIDNIVIGRNRYE